MKLLKGYSSGEEVGNYVTHLIGAGMAIAGIPLFIVKSSQLEEGRGLYLLGTLVFSITLLAMFSFSSTYHLVSGINAKRVLKVFDHSAIFFLIAGTYTAVICIAINTQKGFAILIAQWILTFLGIFFKVKFAARFKFLSVGIYLAMGWMALFILKDFLNNVNETSIWLILAGGLSYSVGTIFYIMKRVPYTHMIWHIFVLGGGVTHFLGVYFLI